MLLWSPLITLFLTFAADRPSKQRRRRLTSLDIRWWELQESATDLGVAGVPEDLLAWLFARLEGTRVPPLLDQGGTQRLQRHLPPGATLEVDPDTGFWSVHQGRWLITAEPWCPTCLAGQVDLVPTDKDARVAVYQAEAEQRRQQTGEGVPAGATRHLAEFWMPAARLRASPFDYDMVQLGLWQTQ